MRAALVVALGGLRSLDASRARGRGPPATAPPASYDGIETRLLDDDLVNFRVQMTGVATRDDVGPLTPRCAAAHTPLSAASALARHVRTNGAGTGWRLGLEMRFYTISPALPRRLQTLDAEVVTAACRRARDTDGLRHDPWTDSFRPRWG